MLHCKRITSAPSCFGNRDSAVLAFPARAMSLVPRRARFSNEETGMSYQGRQLIVTGGTGALGAAVVGGLIEAAATCSCRGYMKPRLSGLPIDGTNRSSFSAA